MGATYPVGQASQAAYVRGAQAAAKYVNANPEEVVIGPSTTQLLRNLSFAIKFKPGDELVLSPLEHEANLASWVSIAERHDLTVKWWPIEVNRSPKLEVSKLKEVLSPKTKLVACTHASNILATIHDIRAIADAVHEVPGAIFVVDGVSFAPHRRVDVKALDVDFYAFSWYKVYGPHIALLYGRKSRVDELRSLGHYFNPQETLENKLGLAAANFELTQAIPVLVEYLGGDDPQSHFDAVAKHEGDLQSVLLGYLTSRKDITVWGETTTDPTVRVPTVSFTVEGWNSKDLVETIDVKSRFGLRWGHFYSHRLVTTILNDGKGLGDGGVVRVSMVHYNTGEFCKKKILWRRPPLGRSWLS